MIISGFQKLTLLDYPGKVACTVFTAGCQFRCPFCHNASLVTHIDPAARIDEQEILAYLQKRKGVLDGVCITGGEPLLQKDLPAFLRKIRDIGLPVKLDTNGAEPERLLELIDEGLVAYVAMDVKNALDRYADTVGIDGFDTTPIVQSMRLLTEGRGDYEFRTTVVSQFHDEESLLQLAEMLKGAEQWFLQSFVDSGDVIGEGLCAMPEAELRAIAEKAAYFVPNIKIRGI